MCNLYASTELIKTFQETKETISYYIFKEEKYGIKISKCIESSNSKNEETISLEISDDKEFVEELIDYLLKNNNDISQVSYIIEDYLNNSREN